MNPQAAGVFGSALLDYGAYWVDGSERLRTERGEVFIALGEPDGISEAANQVGSGVRFIQWEYMSLRLTLVFQDESGFGEYRLTPLSRSEFQRVLARVRREQ